LAILSTQTKIYGSLTNDLLFTVWNYMRETIFSHATVIPTFMKIHQPVHVYSWKHTWGNYKSQSSSCPRHEGI